MTTTTTVSAVSSAFLSARSSRFRRHGLRFERQHQSRLFLVSKRRRWNKKDEEEEINVTARAASLPSFNFSSSSSSFDSSSSSSSASAGSEGYSSSTSSAYRLSAMEESSSRREAEMASSSSSSGDTDDDGGVGFGGLSFEEALSERERTRSQMFNTEPPSMVSSSSRLESNGSASTSSSSNNSNSGEKIGTFFKHEPREKWKKKNKFPVLFYSKEHEPLAKKIAELEEFSVELGTINWESFNDGFPDLFINDAYDIRDRHVAFLASFHNPEVIFEQLSIIYSLPKMFVASFTLVLPFFPTGTAERVAVEGEVATAVTLARMLSSTPPSRGGPTSAVIFDIHALQERFYFGDAILPCFESGIPMLLKRLQKLEDAQNVVIAYPDEGAYKRFHSFFDRAGYESVVCTKVRQKEKRIVKLKEGEPAGRHCVIVDDLVQSGGTLIECQTLLQKLGATKVSAYVTHGVFPNKSWKRFTSEGAGGQGFSNFWITDSCPMTVKDVEGLKPFEVLSLARRIAKALQI